MGKLSPRQLPPLERLLEVLSYDPKTGILRWKINKARMKSGRIAGDRSKLGYWRLNIDGVRYQAHRVIWKMMTGDEPLGNPDHRNLIRDDNRWENLRLGTRAQNNTNVGTRSHNQSGLKGVVTPSKGRVCAKIQANGVRYYLGTFATAEEAHTAYCEKAKILHGEWARFE